MPPIDYNYDTHTDTKLVLIILRLSVCYACAKAVTLCFLLSRSHNYQDLFIGFQTWKRMECNFCDVNERYGYKETEKDDQQCLKLQGTLKVTFLTSVVSYPYNCPSQIFCILSFFFLLLYQTKFHCFAYLHVRYRVILGHFRFYLL